MNTPVRFCFSALLILTAVPLRLSAQVLDVRPGSERWLIKTTVPSTTRKKTLSIDKLLSLKSPIGKPEDAPESTRIPTRVKPANVKEGDMITTTAWLHLVALERASGTHRDGDYHIQIRSDSAWADTCLIVEVPYPQFINDPALKDSCDLVRKFVREKLLNNREPGTAGNILQHPVYVKIKGQLFFDATHLRNDGSIDPRGKRGHAATPMHSYTAWELHPVVSMSFAKRP